MIAWDGVSTTPSCTTSMAERLLNTWLYGIYYFTWLSTINPLRRVFFLEKHMSLTLDEAVAIAMPYAQKHWCWNDESFIREQLAYAPIPTTKEEVEAAIYAIANDFDLAPAILWGTP